MGLQIVEETENPFPQAQPWYKQGHLGKILLAGNRNDRINGHDIRVGNRYERLGRVFVAGNIAECNGGTFQRCLGFIDLSG